MIGFFIIPNIDVLCVSACLPVCLCVLINWKIIDQISSTLDVSSKLIKYSLSYYCAWPTLRSIHSKNDCLIFSIKLYTILNLSVSLNNSYPSIDIVVVVVAHVFDVNDRVTYVICRWIINGIRTIWKISNFKLLTELRSDDEKMNINCYPKKSKTNEKESCCPSFMPSLFTYTNEQINRIYR